MIFLDFTARLFSLLLILTAAPALALYQPTPVSPTTERPLTPVIIDAGHGGDDFGAVVKSVKEKDLALAFALKLRLRLQKNSRIPVLLTRKDDSFVPLDKRLIESVDYNGAVFISLHLNQIKGKKATGAVVYSYGPEQLKAWRKRLNNVPPMPPPPRLQMGESARLARLLVKSLQEKGFKAESARSDYYVLKNPSQPSILIELGYLNNPDEALRLTDSSYQDKMVESLALAIERYMAQSQKTHIAAAAPAGL